MMFEDEIKMGMDDINTKVKATFKDGVVRFTTPKAGYEVPMDEILQVTHKNSTVKIETFSTTLTIHKNYMVIKHG